MVSVGELLDRLGEKDYDCVEEYQIRKKQSGVNDFKVVITVTDHIPYELRLLLSSRGTDLLSGSIEESVTFHLCISSECDLDAVADKDSR